MRLGVVLCVFVFLGLGALFGALNAGRIGLDFYFARLSVPKGGALLGALSLGWLLGGIVLWLGRVPRLKRELRRCRRELQDASKPPPRDRSP
ncbi:MAG: lipopolysaccharide assembly protein LapA domain-containing protein [Rhodanobacteraceae bacterium]